MASCSLSSLLYAAPGPAMSSSSAPVAFPAIAPFPAALTAAPVAAATFEGIPSRTEVDTAVLDYVRALDASKSATALGKLPPSPRPIASAEYTKMVQFLERPTRDQFVNSERARIRAHYRLAKDGAVTVDPKVPSLIRVLLSTRQVPMGSAAKPVARREDFFDIITAYHCVGGQHLGRDKTMVRIHEMWSEIPKWAVNLYLQNCPTCRSRVKGPKQTPQKVRKMPLRKPAVRSISPSLAADSGSNTLATPPVTPSPKGKKRRAYADDEEDGDWPLVSPSKKHKVEPVSTPRFAKRVRDDEVDESAPAGSSKKVKYDQLAAMPDHTSTVARVPAPAAYFSMFGPSPLNTPRAERTLAEEDEEDCFLSPSKRQKSAVAVVPTPPTGTACPAHLFYPSPSAFSPVSAAAPFIAHAAAPGRAAIPSPIASPLVAIPAPQPHVDASTADVEWTAFLDEGVVDYLPTSATTVGLVGAGNAAAIPPSASSNPPGQNVPIALPPTPITPTHGATSLAMDRSYSSQDSINSFWSIASTETAATDGSPEVTLGTAAEQHPPAQRTRAPTVSSLLIFNPPRKPRAPNTLHTPPPAPRPAHARLTALAPPTRAHPPAHWYPSTPFLTAVQELHTRDEVAPRSPWY
ncbi:hypothetical protein JCM10450v2_001173 [Rhodotorula kratochvilovae]